MLWLSITAAALLRIDYYNYLTILEYSDYLTILIRYTCIRYQGANLWNSMDNFFKAANDLNHFKTLVSTWEGPQCNCLVYDMCVLSYL